MKSVEDVLKIFFYLFEQKEDYIKEIALKISLFPQYFPESSQKIKAEINSFIIYLQNLHQFTMINKHNLSDLRDAFELVKEQVEHFIDLLIEDGNLSSINESNPNNRTFYLRVYNSYIISLNQLEKGLLKLEQNTPMIEKVINFKNLI